MIQHRDSHFLGNLADMTHLLQRIFKNGRAMADILIQIRKSNIPTANFLIGSNGALWVCQKLYIGNMRRDRRDAYFIQGLTNLRRRMSVQAGQLYAGITGILQLLHSTFKISSGILTDRKDLNCNG